MESSFALSGDFASLSLSTSKEFTFFSCPNSPQCPTLYEEGGSINACFYGRISIHPNFLGNLEKGKGRSRQFSQIVSVWLLGLVRRRKNQDALGPPATHEQGFSNAWSSLCSLSMAWRGTRGDALAPRELYITLSEMFALT